MTMKRAIWMLSNKTGLKPGPITIELANGRSTTVQVNSNGFFITDEIPPPGFAIYVRPFEEDAAPSRQI